MEIRYIDYRGYWGDKGRLYDPKRIRGILDFIKDAHSPLSRGERENFKFYSKKDGCYFRIYS